jgi:hypothetical protein
MSEEPTEYSRQSALALRKLKLPFKINGSTSIRITLIFLASGIASLTLSIFTSSNVLALIGLGLTFWGAHFLFISPKRRVDGRLLYDTVIASYVTMDRIIADLGYKGKGHYIPPYPRDVYLPEHLEGLKNPAVFISAKEKFEFPSIEEMAENKFLLKNPKGALITPPGLGLLEQIENKLRIDYAKTDLNELTEMLPRFILENLDIAEDITMTNEASQIKLRIANSLYNNLYGNETKSKSVSLLGCPIASAVACVLAKATGKPVAIKTYKRSPDGFTVQIEYSIEQGQIK